MLRTNVQKEVAENIEHLIMDNFYRGLLAFACVSTVSIRKPDIQLSNG
jgi:hypothetical protein